MELVTSTSTIEGRAVVTVQGDVDLVSCDELRRALGDAVRTCPDVLVDLSGLTFIDSSGLSALVDAHRRARDAGGVLTLRNPTTMLRRLLAITHLDTLLVLETAETAAAGEQA